MMILLSFKYSFVEFCLFLYHTGKKVNSNDTCHRRMLCCVVVVSVFCLLLMFVCMSQIPLCMRPVLSVPEPLPSSRPGHPSSTPLLRFTRVPHWPTGGSGEASNLPPSPRSFPWVTGPVDRGRRGPGGGGGGLGWQGQRSRALLQHCDALWGDGHASAPPCPQEAPLGTTQLLPERRGSFEKHEHKIIMWLIHFPFNFDPPVQNYSLKNISLPPVYDFSNEQIQGTTVPLGQNWVIVSFNFKNLWNVFFLFV